VKKIEWLTVDGEVRHCYYEGYTDAQLHDIGVKTIEVNPMLVSYKIV